MKIKKSLSVILALVMILSTLSILSVNSFATGSVRELLESKAWVECSNDLSMERGYMVVNAISNGKFYMEIYNFPNFPYTISEMKKTVSEDFYEDNGYIYRAFSYTDDKGNTGVEGFIYQKVSDNCILEYFFMDEELVDASLLLDGNTFKKAVNCLSALDNSEWSSTLLSKKGIEKITTESYRKIHMYKDGNEIDIDEDIEDLALVEAYPIDMNTVAAVFVDTEGDTVVDTWTRIGEERIAFPDVKAGEWYYDNVINSVKAGYFKGYADGTFGPGKNIIRQDFAVVMAKAAGADLDDQSTDNLKFPDINKNDYYAKALAWCVENGIISGYANGNFGPADPITREQICVMVTNYVDKFIDGTFKLNDADKVNSILNKYPDQSRVSDWARTAVASCINAGVISGANGGKEVQSFANANRAQIATIFMNMRSKDLLV